MNVPTKDIIATGLVSAAVAVYLLWLTDVDMGGTRVAGTIILVLGFAASALAVVPSFDALIHGSRAYLAVTSLLGLVALVGGVVMLLSESEAALAVLISTMVVLWAISTAHHTRLAKAAASHREPGIPTGASSTRVPADR